MHWSAFVIYVSLSLCVCVSLSVGPINLNYAVIIFLVLWCGLVSRFLVACNSYSVLAGNFFLTFTDHTDSKYTRGLYGSGIREFILAKYNHSARPIESRIGLVP